MSWKEWDQGEVVEAGDFQEYIQDQVVQNYADSAARSTALGTAVAEGMVSYLQDSNSVEVYDGSAWSQVGAYVSHNYIINGAFDFWQRGTAITTTSTEYTADRWRLTSGQTITRTAFTAGELEVASFGGSEYYANIAYDNILDARIFYRIEDVRTLAGQECTLSFYAKSADAAIFTGLEVRQLFNGSAGVDTILTPPTITSSWARYSFTFTMPSVSGKTIGNNSFTFLQLELDETLNTSLDLWGVQLEAGSIATPFKRNANSIQGELAACQRYYRRLTIDTGKAITNASSWSTSRAYGVIVYPVPMRVSPDIEASDPNALLFLAAGTTYNGTSYGEVLGRTDSTQFYVNTTGMTLGESGWIRLNDDDDWLEFDAEL